jgi:hypothetical protein
VKRRQASEEGTGKRRDDRQVTARAGNAEGFKDGEKKLKREARDGRAL